MIGFLSGLAALLLTLLITRRVMTKKLLPHPRRPLPVSEAMDRKFHAVGPEDSLGDAARWLVETGQHALPIVEHGTTLGVLTRCDVANGIKLRGASATIAHAPHHEAVTVAPGDSVDGVVERLAHGHDAIAVVVEDGEPIGVATAEQLATFVALHGERPEAR